VSKAKFEAVKELIQAKQYAEARAILKTIDHPTAREFLTKLDRINPEPLPPTKPKQIRGAKIKLALLGIGLLIIAIFVISQLQDQARINRYFEQMKRNSQIAYDAIDKCSNNTITEVREACVELYKVRHGYIYASNDTSVAAGTPIQDQAEQGYQCAGGEDGVYVPGCGAYYTPVPKP
jgi:hypothetical protein